MGTLCVQYVDMLCVYVMLCSLWLHEYVLICMVTYVWEHIDNTYTELVDIMYTCCVVMCVVETNYSVWW